MSYLYIFLIYCIIFFLQIKNFLTPLEIMASLIAAVAHDLDHPGVNQPFLIATSNHLATLYEVPHCFIILYYSLIILRFIVDIVCTTQNRYFTFVVMHFIYSHDFFFFYLCASIIRTPQCWRTTIGGRRLAVC